MEWTTVSSLVRLGKKAYDNKHLIQRYWTKMKAYLDMGATQVVITGHAGAGKTLLGTGKKHVLCLSGRSKMSC